MKKSLKKPLTVFFILNLVFFVAWLVVLAIYGLQLAGWDFTKFLNEYLMGEVTVFNHKRGFVTGVMEIFVKDGTFFPRGFTPDKGELFWTTYVGIAVAAIAIVGIIVGIILLCIRQRKRWIPWFLMILASALPVLVFAGNPTEALKITSFYSSFCANWIFVFGILLAGLLAYVFAFVTYFLGLARAKELKTESCVEETPVVEEPTEEKVEEIPVEEVKEPVSNEVEDVNETFTTVAAATSTEPVVSEEVPTPAPDSVDTFEPMSDFLEEPAEIAPEKEEIIVEEIPVEEDNKAEQAPALDANALASMIKDVVRDIVRDEIARNNAAKPEEEHRPHGNNQPSITGATFGGPLVVQYFNGGINSPVEPAPAPAPAPKAEPAPAPAPAPKPQPKPEKKEEPAPVVVEPAPVVVEPVIVPVPAPAPAEDDKAKIVRIPFEVRITTAEKDMQDNYNEIKNEFLSYGVKSRVSNSGDTFRLHRKTYAKLTVAGKSLKLYFALDPKDYAEGTIPVQDASDKAIYEEIPLIFKVKSPLSLRRCKQLIQDCMEKDGLEQKEVGSVNWVKELKAEMKAGKKPAKEEDDD